MQSATRMERLNRGAAEEVEFERLSELIRQIDDVVPQPWKKGIHNIWVVITPKVVSGRRWQTSPLKIFGSCELRQPPHPGSTSGPRGRSSPQSTNLASETPPLKRKGAPFPGRHAPLGWPIHHEDERALLVLR